MLPLDALLRRIVELVEDEGFEDVRMTLHLSSGQTVSGKLVPSSFALTPIAEAHLDLAAALIDDDETDYGQAMTLRVASEAGEDVIRLNLEAVCWWSFLPDPLDAM